MANIFEDGITHSNFEAILTDPGLLAALQVSEWSAGDFKTVNKNLIEVGWEQIREILAKIYKVQAPVATIALDDIDLEASLHNAARVDVVLDLQRINRVLNAALHNEYPVPHLVAWKMPNGFIKLLDGLHRYTTFRAVKRKSLKAYLVECDETIADLIARSLNAHCGIGQLTEYSVSQAVEYVINKGVGNGRLLLRQQLVSPGAGPYAAVRHRTHPGRARHDRHPGAVHQAAQARPAAPGVQDGR
jgi:hypothetical protein